MYSLTAVSSGPTTSSRIASCPSCVTLDTVSPPVSPSSRCTRSKISKFVRTYTSHRCSLAGRRVPWVLHRCFQGSPLSWRCLYSAANPSQNGTLRHPDINLVLSHRAQEMYRRRLTHIGPATRHRICVAISSPRCLHVRTHSWGLSLPAVSPCRQQG